MKLAGITCTDEEPLAFPEAVRQRPRYLHKLAVNVVDSVFIQLDGVDRVLKLSGQQAPSATDYCLCHGGNYFTFCVCFSCVLRM